ncbi:hypothetical protein HOLleu_28758 [Holothuria leucospilota]|uniref:LRAT domain-containing protein n=1 Tax=Holothuria leucospilota TaxID=206669 RepID=A0A9Q1BMJ3_HOLLE|nr:hypothetical protein HOLleu_28758 [Holothuria leucospilota]
MSLHGACNCGNNDPSKFFIIRKSGALWGISCMNRTCGAEYLIDRFCKPGNESIKFNNQVLHFNPPTSVKKDPKFQVRLSRKRIKNVADLKPGDHVGFDRLYLIWHHAIVVEAQAKPFKLVVDGWDGKFYKMKRVRKSLKQRDVKHMYKFFYSQKVEQENPPELVLARSKSRLHAKGESAGWARPVLIRELDDRYGFLNANCEHFATYCKTGDSFCIQNHWARMKLKETAREFLLRSGKTFMKELCSKVAPEVLENIVQYLLNKGSNFLFEGIGLTGVVLVELLSFEDAYKKLKDQLGRGEIGKDVYYVELGRKLMEFLTVAGIAGGGGLVVASLGAPWAEVVLSPVLMIAAKAANRLVTRFLGDGLLKYLGKAYDWLPQTPITSIKNFLVDKFRKCIEGCEKAMAWVKEKVCEITKSVCTKVGRIVKNAIEWLSRGWNWLGNKIVDAENYLVAKLNQCLQNCKKALSWMKTEISELTKFVGSKLEKFAKKVVESVASGWKWLQKKVDDSRKYLVDKFNQCWKVCTTVPTKISKAASYVSNKVCQVANCVRKALAKPVRAVVNAVSKLFSWLL